MSTLIEVNNLHLTTGDKTLIENLSFKIEAGERFGLIGESGSGKSLTSLAIMGLLASNIVATGSVALDGHEVIGAPERELNTLRGASVACVFQEPLTALDPLMRVGRQIGEVVKRRRQRTGEPSREADVQAEVVMLAQQVLLPNVERLLKSYPHEMSGGQRQRIAIAMALACKPKLLIADEPTTALDVTTQAEIVALLKRLVIEHGMALLFISHDLPVVSQIVDRVMVLKNGEAIETGTIAEVFGSPSNDYTRLLLDAAHKFDDALGEQA